MIPRRTLTNPIAFSVWNASSLAGNAAMCLLPPKLGPERGLSV
jgi:hypothetical protein